MEQNAIEPDVLELKRFLNTIPSGDVNRIVNELIEKVHSNRVIFRNWKLGLTKVPILERTLMNEYAREKFNTEIFNTDDLCKPRTKPQNQPSEY